MICVANSNTEQMREMRGEGIRTGVDIQNNEQRSSVVDAVETEERLIDPELQ